MPMTELAKWLRLPRYACNDISIGIYNDTGEKGF